MKRKPRCRAADPELLSKKSQELFQTLSSRIVGQDRAIAQFVRVMAKVNSKLAAPNRPLATLLFMGPTGVGKTEVCHTLAEALHGDRNKRVRIDCSEFQSSHEISKLIGSPPGYLGHRETTALLAQKKLGEATSANSGISILIFDEIEKAHPALLDMLLQILEDGRLTMGNGDVTDFQKTIIVMTANLGSRETNTLITGSGIGFNSQPEHHDDLDQKIYVLSREAAKRHFRPEFLNRLDRIIVFRSLSKEHMKIILEIQLSDVLRRLDKSEAGVDLVLSNRAKDYLLEEGTDSKSGARQLRRVLEREVVDAVVNIISSEQAKDGDSIVVDYENDKLTFDVCTPVPPKKEESEI